jgi:hypothetical protein
MTCGLIYGTGSSTAVARTAAHVACRTGYAPGNPRPLSVTPDPNIGQIGKRSPLPGHPAWDGDDRINDSAYVKATNIVYLVGRFTAYDWHGVAYKRHNAVAINATTGRPTAWAPNVDGEILAVKASCSGDSIYIGGSFHHVNGATRHFAARVSTTTGKTFLWNPKPNATVRDISIGRGHLIVSGSFSRIGGVRRHLIASVNGESGRATGWLRLSITGHEPEGSAHITKFVVNNAGTYGVAIGNFNSVNARLHRRIFVVHFTKSHVSLQRWSTPLTASNHNSNVGTDCSRTSPGPERDVGWTPDDRRFGTASSGGAHTKSICDSASIWSASRKAMTSKKNRPLAIQYTGGDTLSAILLTNTLGWASGHNRWANNPPTYPAVRVQRCSDQSPVNPNPGYAGYGCKGPGAVDDPGLIGFSLSSMRATSWNPGRSRQQSEHNTMFFTSLGMCIGSDGDEAAGEAHNDLACFPFLNG